MYEKRLVPITFILVNRFEVLRFESFYLIIFFNNCSKRKTESKFIIAKEQVRLFFVDEYFKKKIRNIMLTYFYQQILSKIICAFGLVYTVNFI